MSDNQKWSILQGDALKVLGTFAPNTFDAVITDPPYASGGRTQAEKNKSTARKYSSMGENAPPPFDGDAKDQRSWTRWAAEWLYEARKVSFFLKRCGPGPPVLESTYLSKNAPPSAENSQRRRWRRWRKHRANVHLHSLPRIPRSPMPPAGGKLAAIRRRKEKNVDENKKEHHLHIVLTTQQYQLLCCQAKECRLTKRAYG